MKFAILFLIAGMFTTACQKENELIEPELSQNESQEKETNYLSFNSMADFLVAQSEINTGTNSKTLKESKQNFVSMYSVLSEIDNAASEQEYNELIKKHEEILDVQGEGVFDVIIPDLALASIVSVDGLIEIGDTIYKIERDFVKAITNGDKSKISTLNNYSETDVNAEIMIYPITKNTEKGSWSKTDYYQSGYKDWVKKWSYSYGAWNNVGGKIYNYKWVNPWWRSGYWSRTNNKLEVWVSWSKLSYRVLLSSGWVYLEEGSKTIHDYTSSSSSLQESYTPAAGMMGTTVPVVSNFVMRYRINGVYHQF